MIGESIAGRYRILRELGRGGMGAVYLAEDTVLEREVAIKLLTTPFRRTTGSREERFRREALIVARMDHPAIVGIFDIGDHEGNPYLVMPFVPGQNLRSAFREEELTLDDVIEVGLQVAEALDYSHGLGVVHRDIKPENVIVERREPGELRARVTDFGLAMAPTSDRLTKSGSVIGTASYLSPEQAQGREVDGRSDLYSLAVVLYEALTGEVPFLGPPHTVLYRIVHEPPPPPSERIPGFDPALEALLLRELSKDPADRHPRGLDFSRALAECRAGLIERDGGSRRIPTPRSENTGRRRRRSLPLVGRETEMAELRARLEAALDGGGQFVLLGGETGIGKSRLLEELETVAETRGARVLHGRFVEQDLHFPYQGFCEAIQEYFVDRSRSSEVTAEFVDLAPELVALFPVLSEVDAIRSSTAELSLRTAPPPRIEDRTYVFELLARAFSRIAAEGPLVLLLEGLHAAEVSLEALQYIVRRLGPAPVLAVGTYRSTQIGQSHPLISLLDAFDGDRRFASLRLQALSREEIGELLLRTSPETPLEESLFDQLFDSAEGNPYFTLELFRTLLDAGSIQKTPEGRYALAEDHGVGPPVLPATIQQAVEKRIEGLPSSPRKLLAGASVLGRSFHYADLEVLVRDSDALEETVDLLIERGFLEEPRETRGDTLRFTSAVVRDVLYTSLSRRARRRLHRRFAEHLELRYQGQLDRYYDQLVHHFAQADVPEKVVRYGLELARRELDLASPDEAARTARLVLDFLEDPEEDGHEIEGLAREILGRSLRLGGDLVGATAELSRALAAFETAGLPADRLRVLVVAAETSWEARRVEEARQLVEEGLDRADRDEAAAARLRLLSLGITLANLRGDYELAERYLAEQRGLEPSEEVQGPRMESGGRMVVGVPARVRALHPASVTTNEEEEILANVYETLLRADAEGALVPHLCRRWQMSEDGRLLQLELRDDVRFQDGTPLDAETVCRSLAAAARIRPDPLPAALAPIAGIDELLSGRAESIPGARAVGGLRVEIELSESLPGYPMLLTDPWLAVSLPGEPGPGTGPFRIGPVGDDRITLMRNPDYWDGRPPLLDELEFRTGLSASSLARALRDGEIDLGRDLVPEDLEDLLRLRHRGWNLAEGTRKSTCFAIFNQGSPAGSADGLRRAVFGVVRTRDLVRSTLGRLAVPAEGLIPPGILGHDPGRRYRPLRWEIAERLVESSKSSGRIPRLRILVHPILQERYGALTRALLHVWSDLGLDLLVETVSLESYLELSSEERAEIDIVLARWTVDYADPDNFTRGLFHSEMGRFRHRCSSPELDERLDAARRELRLTQRRRMYREIEDSLLSSHRVLPLFHEIDQRIAQPSVQGLRLTPHPPWVDYTELARGEREASDRSERQGGVVQVGFSHRQEELDPHVFRTERWQVTPLVFETLTRQTRDARIVPWLASRLVAEEGGRRFRIELREGVRLQDGRRLDARDVRYSFERLIRQAAGQARWLLAPARGAGELARGESEILEGIRILSSRELELELDSPIPFLPALLTSAPIVPEDSETFTTTWRGGCVGTGPFRIRRFDPGVRLDLEPNPHYWKEDLPRCDLLQMHFGVPSALLVEGFKDGRFSLVGDLAPSEVAALRSHPSFASAFREMPSLATCFLALNPHRGPLAELALRKRVVSAIDVGRLAGEAIGRHGRPARTLVPPDLLAVPPGAASSASGISTGELRGAHLRLLLLGAFEDRYRAITDHIVARLEEAGAEVEILPERHDVPDALDRQRVDLLLSRWSADYPDPDSFAHGLLHSREGDIGPLVGNPETDALVDRARRELDPGDRQELYRDLEELLALRALVVPLFHEQSYRFVRPEVQGFRLLLTEPDVAYERLWIKS